MTSQEIERHGHVFTHASSGLSVEGAGEYQLRLTLGSDQLLVLKETGDVDDERVELIFTLRQSAVWTPSRRAVTAEQRGIIKAVIRARYAGTVATVTFEEPL